MAAYRCKNVPARRWKKQIRVETALGPVIGDIAWGGNWFFLINDHPFAITPEQIPQLTDYAWAVREGLEAAGIRATTAALSTISNSSPMTIPPTAAASYSVRERPGIARRAVPAPAPSWPAWRRMASCSRGKYGARPASSAASLPPATSAPRKASSPRSAAKPGYAAITS